MNRTLLLTGVVACCFHATTRAQMPFSTMDSIDINNINALALVHGDMWWNPGTETAHCYFPKTTHNSINFVSALWMGGYDGGGQLHVSAQTYRQDGNDYWPGPLDAADTLTYATSQKWAKIWKVNRSDINTFRGLATHDSASTPSAIWTWPAKGNTHARGNGGAALTLDPSRAYAPFVDVNTDGNYDPLAGDYPDVPGDQALWWVFSDNGPTHNASGGGKPFKLEIQVTAYAYSRGTLIDNVVYYKYHVINQSPNTYTNFRMGLFDDMDLGYYADDYIGYDSSHRMGIAYNGNNDDGFTGGHPAGSYGTQIPIVGVTLIKLPGDGASPEPPGSFLYYNNDMSAYGNPSVDTQYNNYLRSKFKLGAHLTNDYTTPGTPSYAYGSGPDVNYVYPGDPSVLTEWSECASGNIAGDRRFVIASHDLTLLPGSENDVVMALVATPPDTSNGCPSGGFTDIKHVADTAWGVYTNPLPDLGTNIPTAVHTMNIYPNPAQNQLTIVISGTITTKDNIAIYNTLGQRIATPLDQQGKNYVADISSLAPGLYHVVYQNNGNVSGTFIKQ